MTTSELHTHVDERGHLIKCYHTCKSGVIKLRDLLLSWEFWVATTLTFPIEHLIWRIGPLKTIANWVGM
jgi:hypothetical protein